ncbi:MAG: tetratricopeptide repeat protein [Thiomargarita sp.]|nr:tetratricopeptide repeat protein [Thiomargarita sp.]
MHKLKTIILVPLFIIFSLTGLRAEETLLDQMMQLNQEGQQAYNISDYPTASEKWEQGLKLARQAKHQQGISVFIDSLGIVYKNLGDYPKALEYYQQALKIAKEIGDQLGIGNNLTNIGVVYDNLGDYPKAKQAFQKAIVINKKIEKGETWLALRGLAFTETKQHCF